MKTLSTRNFFNYLYNKPLLLCRNILKDLRSFALACCSRGAFISLLKKLSLVHVGRELNVGLHALADSATVNKRLFVGLVLIGIMAPLAGCFYLLFDKTDSVEGWYYVNNFYLLLVLGPSFKEIVVFVGVYHLFPKDSKRAYLLSIPMGFSIGKILWLLTITSNDQFHSITPFDFVFTGVVISAGLFFSIDWLIWRWSHRAMAFDARLKLIYQNADEFSHEKVISMFKTTMREKLEFPKQY